MSPPFTLSDLNRTFSALTLTRGRTYARSGRVTTIGGSAAGDFTATVRGSDRTPYFVDLHVRPRSSGSGTLLSGTCTCPVGRNCKHAAAAAFAILQMTAGSTAPGAQRPRPSPDESRLLALPSFDSPNIARSDGFVDSRVGFWLGELGRVADPAEAPRPASEEFVTYVIAPNAGSHVTPGLPVAMHAARRSKTGAILKTRSLTMESLAHALARCVAPDDALIGRTMLAIETSDRMRAELHADVMRRIVETGRAFYGDLKREPLRLEEPRAGTIAWAATTEGRLRPRLSVDLEDATILRGASLWYVDPISNAIGPISHELGAAVIAKLLEAPDLLGDDARSVSKLLKDRFPHLNIPTPVDIRETIEPVAPIPQMTLRTVTVDAAAAFDSPLRRYMNVEPETIDFIDVTFAYGTVTIDPVSRTVPHFERAADGVTVVHPRVDATESTLLVPLVDFGFVREPRRERYPGARGLLLRLPSDDDNGGWAEFVHRVVPTLRAAGWRVDIEHGFRRRIVDTSADDLWHPLVEERPGGWFDVSIGLDVEGRRVAMLPLLRELMAKGSLTTDVLDARGPDGAYLIRFPAEGFTIAFPAARIRAIVHTLVELGDSSATLQNGRLRLPRARSIAVDRMERESKLQWGVPERLRALSARLRDFSGIERVEPPQTLQGTLRAYQHDGLDWLAFLREFGFGGILADDMGLGKSIQTIAHILREKEAGRLEKPALLVVPTSLVFNWCDELARFAPSLRVVTLHGSDRADRIPQLRKCDVAITTYALLVRDEIFAKRTWPIVVLDEAQFLKNPLSKAAQTAAALKSDHRICLTGTPVENHLGDLWSLFAIALPGALGDRTSFGRLFRAPIEKRNDADRGRALAERIRPFVLRRTKEDVASELPPKTEIVRRVELGGTQRDLYETVRIAMRDRVQDEIARHGLARSQIVILDALLKLRQVCCDPRLLPPRFKTNAPSAKLDALVEMLPEMIEEGRRILLFSQFTSMLDLIVPELEKRDIAYAQLTGATTDRAGNVKRFEAGEVPVFLISLKAGGTGLNLIAADTVIHYDPWWNPAVERQATDRAHRIGQTKNVFVYKLIGAETVEQKILDLQVRKAQLAATIFAEKPNADAGFEREDIERLFAPIGDAG